MWKPGEVISPHRKRAVGLWLVVMVSIIAYSVLLVSQAIRKRDNPSTSFTISNDRYAYPDVYVCLYNFFGCDRQDLEGECIASVDDTQGGETSATFNPGLDNEMEIAKRAFLTDERGFCVAFNVSDVPVTDEERDAEDYVRFNMYWYPGGGAGGSTTCISEDGDWESHSESVFVFLRDSSTGNYSAGVQVAYNCMTSASSSHVFNFVGIGLTVVDKLDHEDIGSYTAVSTSSALYKDKRDGNISGIENPYAWLSMEIAQTTDSLVTITEINPLEIAEILGNIGGFYDLLLILWPVFFVAVTREDPALKARNFRKSVVRGAQRAMGVKNTIALSEPRKAGLESNVGETETSENRPAWDTAHSEGQADPS